MFNLNKTSRNGLMYIVVLMSLISVLAIIQGGSSNYQPRPITVNAISEKSIFDLSIKKNVSLGPPKVALTPSLSPRVDSVVLKIL